MNPIANQVVTEATINNSVVAEVEATINKSTEATNDLELLNQVKKSSNYYINTINPKGIDFKRCAKSLDIVFGKFHYDTADDKTVIVNTKITGSNVRITSKNHYCKDGRDYYVIRTNMMSMSKETIEGLSDEYTKGKMNLFLSIFVNREQYKSLEEGELYNIELSKGIINYRRFTKVISVTVNDLMDTF